MYTKKPALVLYVTLLMLMKLKYRLLVRICSLVLAPGHGGLHPDTTPPCFTQKLTTSSTSFSRRGGRRGRRSKRSGRRSKRGRRKMSVGAEGGGGGSRRSERKKDVREEEEQEREEEGRGSRRGSRRRTRRGGGDSAGSHALTVRSQRFVLKFQRLNATTLKDLTFCWFCSR